MRVILDKKERKTALLDALSNYCMNEVFLEKKLKKKIEYNNRILKGRFLQPPS